MSFDGYCNEVREGDTVILYVTINQIYSLKAIPSVITKKGKEQDHIFQTPYGALKCAQIIGKPYGSKVELSKGWAYILQPTPELWTITLPHRTQIIYTPDISMILLQLEIKPGSVVVESGTGSGSLSHGLIKALRPHGHLYTFDFHQARVEIARHEFEDHGLTTYVTVQHQDVLLKGFGDELKGKADAVFLDLPSSWQAVAHAFNTLKDIGGRICSFSPCIEQVQKSCLELSRLGFREIETIEVLQTQYSVQPKNLTVANFDFLKTEKSGNSKDAGTKSQERETVKVMTAMAPKQLPGHTGYLTFATKYPVWSQNICMDDDCEMTENVDDESRKTEQLS